MTRFGNTPYVRQQLNRIEDPSRAGIKIRDGEGNETHWMSITAKDFNDIRDILLGHNQD